ncbi:MAG TPA: hypothetical protein VGA20_09575 [Gemmatimonadales bacterium]
MLLLSLLIAGAAAGAGFYWTRTFVRRRLRFVDAIQKPAAPIVAGVAAAALIAGPAALLPVIGAGTVALFGAGVAAGVASGRRDQGGS